MAFPSPIRWDIAKEHLDEAAFLRQLWEQSLCSPQYSLAEIAQGPEERMLAHLDALVLGGARVARVSHEAADRMVVRDGKLVCEFSSDGSKTTLSVEGGRGLCVVWSTLRTQ